MATFIVMLGPPGVGKGTQAKILSEKTGLAHISSGDLFRENLKNQTELGKLAQTYMTKGELVPDDVTVSCPADVPPPESLPDFKTRYANEADRWGDWYHRPRPIDTRYAAMCSMSIAGGVRSMPPSACPSTAGS